MARPQGAQVHNWRGGRTITAHGYILVRVGKAHPLADVRGYAYEHRVVMSNKLGRWVTPEEIVHHKDEDRTNNSPENLEVKNGNAEHYLEHRKRHDLRRPGEKNTEIACECGCGSMFARFDGSGRPRRFLPGHNKTRRARG